ncbi:DUF3772 domain-containing protein [Rhodalgimonas zhirmunskyi]|uniref:DUF3772 domain-containing protein n=1 Tax=Rhodalgimonas zhirmunskyi TaxID=2964767 RepID=A0AAJ1X4X0_9RHOB|nr:DUF3772 domain-containing protein [Rhodoalgimonas zhirmunskyi]MDQ2092964.1 DUF3772 domain-containing protein [Rhodoalgimonas zhirmunskyi]
MVARMSRLGPLLLAVTLWAVLAVAAMAQTDDQGRPDYEQWKSVATRAEDAIEAERASDQAFGTLRDQLVTWRQQFLDAQSINSKTIQTVQAQIKALGAAPEGDATEPDDIATQRTDLNARLAQLQAPVKTAEVAFSQADGLISAIDGILRERQAEALLARGPTPLNPATWGEGWSAFTGALQNTWGEIVTAWDTAVQNGSWSQKAPEVLLLLVVGLVMLLRGRRWMMRLGAAVQAKRATPSRWLIAFFLSLGQVAVPVVGLSAIIEALSVSGIVGQRLDPLLREISSAGLLIFIAMWLGVRVFPKGDVPQGLMQLSPERMREGRLVTGLIGLVLAAFQLFDEFGRSDNWTDETRAILFFPLIVLGGTLIWRVGSLLRGHGKAAAENADGGAGADTGVDYSAQLITLIGRVLVIVSFIGPVLAAVGYRNAAEMAVFPVLKSLLLLAFLMVVQRVLAELWVLIRRNEDAREGLVPMVAGILVLIVSAPFFALIWGVSETRLGEIWLRLQEGFQVGTTRISPTNFLTFAVLFAVGYVLTRMIQGGLKNTLLPKTKIDPGGRNAIVSGVGYIGIFLAAVIAITTAGIDLSSLALVAGALSVGIGFGLQNIVSNFVSGIILLIERPISEGDWIEVGGNMGYVRDISVRSTRIETFDRTDVIVPNSDFVSGTVTNYTRGNTVGRLILPVGVAYGTDTRRVEAILREIAEAHPMVLMTPPPGVVFQGFGASSLDFEIRAILRDVNFVLSVKSEMNHQIAKRFVEEEIEIPFLQTDIWLRNPEALRAGPADPAKADPEATPAAGKAPAEAAFLSRDDLDTEGGEDGGDK